MHGGRRRPSAHPQNTKRRARPVAKEAGASFFAGSPTVTTARHVSRSLRGLRLDELVEQIDPVPVLVGNTVDTGAALELMETGIHAILVGVGPGAACTSREVLGIGIPQVSATLDTAYARDLYHEQTGRYVPIITDGGIRTGGDLSKSICAGADAVMIGSPFAATKEDGRIYGLGANNCKGSAAVHLWLADEVARRGGPAQGSVVFVLAGDEERLGLEGTAYLREEGLIEPDALVLGSPTENQIIVEERGILWLEIETAGRAAHGGDPPAGDNAILRMMRLLDRLQAELGPRLDARRSGGKVSTMNIGTLHGGENPNVVPDRCTARIDRRLLPDEPVEEAHAEMEAVLAGAGEPKGSYAVHRPVGTNGFSAPLDGPFVSALTAAIEDRLGRPPEVLNALAASDGRFFARDGIEIVNFGPGDGAISHAANEFIPLAEMVDAALILRTFVERTFGFALSS